MSPPGQQDAGPATNGTGVPNSLLATATNGQPDSTTGRRQDWRDALEQARQRRAAAAAEQKRVAAVNEARYERRGLERRRDQDVWRLRRALSPDLGGRRLSYWPDGAAS